MTSLEQEECTTRVTGVRFPVEELLLCGGWYKPASRRGLSLSLFQINEIHCFFGLSTLLILTLPFNLYTLPIARFKVLIITVMLDARQYLLCDFKLDRTDVWLQQLRMWGMNVYGVVESTPLMHISLCRASRDLSWPMHTHDVSIQSLLDTYTCHYVCLMSTTREDTAQAQNLSKSK